MRKIIFTEQQQKDILDLYYQGNGYRYISRELNLTPDPVYGFLCEKGLHRPRKNNKRIYTVNENYFNKIDNEHKAYWLGFISADGCVSRNTLSFNLKRDESNYQLLQQFKKDINSNANITTKKQDAFGVEVEIYSLDINSSVIVKDLKKLGVVPHKSLILQFPTEDQVPTELLKHFVRGYFDGDGSITRTKKTNCYSLSFAGTKEFLEGIQRFFDVKVAPKKDNRSPDKNIYYFSFGGNLQTIEKGAMIYNESTIYLQRKFDIYQELLSQYDENKIKQHKKYSSLAH